MYYFCLLIMRLYILWKCGGWGLLNVKIFYNCEVCNFREYFLKVNEGMYWEVVVVDNGFILLFLVKENWCKFVVLSVNDCKEVWYSKEFYGCFFWVFYGFSVDFLVFVFWLWFSNFFGEIEGFVCVIMDEVIFMNNYWKYIIKDGIVDICWVCYSFGEFIRYIIFGCGCLVNGEYLYRYN